MLSAAVGTVAAIVAAVDWWAVRVGHRRVESVAKPLVMVALIVLALTLDADPPVARWLMITGLAFGLVGDVMLLPQVDRFLAGLGAFFVGHLFYIGALATMDLAFIGIVGGVAAAAVIMAYLGVPIVRAVHRTELGIPVLAYMALVSALVVAGTATHRWPIAIGGVLFACSDALLGRDRFVAAAPHRRYLVHVLYHLGQAGLVLGLPGAL